MRRAGHQPRPGRCLRQLITRQLPDCLGGAPVAALRQPRGGEAYWWGGGAEAAGAWYGMPYRLTTRPSNVTSDQLVKISFGRSFSQRAEIFALLCSLDMQVT
jgi:hypothetical protein